MKKTFVLLMIALIPALSFAQQETNVGEYEVITWPSHVKKIDKIYEVGSFESADSTSRITSLVLNEKQSSSADYDKLIILTRILFDSDTTLPVERVVLYGKGGSWILDKETSNARLVPTLRKVISVLSEPVAVIPF